MNAIDIRRSSISGDLAAFVVDRDFDGLPPDVVHATKRLILDTLACIVGAAGTEPGKLLLDLHAELGGRPDSSLATRNARVACTNAVYAHAQMANVLDADETFEAAHFAGVIVSTALAVAEMTGATGKELIAAVAVGYDVAGRICTALPAFYADQAGALQRSDGMGFSWAAFGAAASAAKLMGLSAEQLAHAWGIAAVTMPVHGAAIAFNGTTEPWYKYSMYGAIAECGLKAALLATRGFVGNPHALDAGGTFYKSLGISDCNYERILSRLGDRWIIAEASFKPYPLCRYANGAIDVFTAILADHALDFDEIDAVILTVPPGVLFEMIASSRECGDRFKIMTSLPYALAMTAHKIPPGPKWWADAVFGSAEYRKFMHKVRHVVDERLNDIFIANIKRRGTLIAGHVPMVIEVEARGETFRKDVFIAHGDPLGPPEAWMTDDELRDKAREFCRDLLPDRATEALIAAAFALEEGNNIDVLTAALANA
jgi:2-methylcitrate dehydratase PrpD